MEGTKFQKSVWKELQNIPYGETRTYREAAAAIGNEKVDESAGAFSNIFNQLNLDIPGGFQDINPLLFSFIRQDFRSMVCSDSICRNRSWKIL